jgi:hypothetical protein
MYIYALNVIQHGKQVTRSEVVGEVCKTKS